MSFKITDHDLQAFAQDYDHRADSAVLENAVTTNGVRAASFNWHSIADDNPKAVWTLLDVCGLKYHAA